MLVLVYDNNNDALRMNTATTEIQHSLATYTVGPISFETMIRKSPKNFKQIFEVKLL